MKQDKRRGLTRIALALTLAGYCVAPVALAEDSAWVDSGETNIFQGTIPWLYSEGGSATTDADRGRYIGIEITPTTQTGTPNVGTALYLYDVSTASGGGSDSDNVAPGPVVNQNLKVAIFVDGTSINLINGSTPIELGKTYVAKLYSDENKNGKFDAGTDADVTANYDFRWVLSGSSQQLGTSGGIVNSSFDNNNLVIPATNDEARTNLNGPARDGKEALSIPTNGDGVQGYKLHIIYKHK